MMTTTLSGHIPNPIHVPNLELSLNHAPTIEHPIPSVPPSTSRPANFAQGDYDTQQSVNGFSVCQMRRCHVIRVEMQVQSLLGLAEMLSRGKPRGECYGS
jgi:hypothetical protein